MAVGSKLLLLGSMVVSAWSWVRIDFWGPVDRGVVHGRGFESLIMGVNGDECMRVRILGLFGGQLWCNNHAQNQQSQPNPTQTIEATRLVQILN
jgi:hypothetical protein